MKTRTLRAWMTVAALVSAPWFAGCDTNTPASSAPPPASASAPPVAQPAPLSPEAALQSTDATATQPEKAQPANPARAVVLPEHLKPSPNLVDVIKLAQAGVDEGVLRSFIVNTRGTFNLGSEEIIYLHDLGVSSDLITAMIEQDRALADAALSSAPTAPSPAPTPLATAGASAVTSAPPAQGQTAPMEAAAPTYTTPPAAPAETAPAAGQTPQGAAALYYQELAPYGTWVHVDGYGLCWQPNVVVIHAGWQPYYHGGRWLYTDYGWYWLSDYTWGARVFHYGRWFRHPRWGWCWYPDTIWGPAWVSWRYWDSYCGWAPLPPAAVYRPGFGFYYYGSSVGWGFEFGLSWHHYAFVPLSRFCDPRPWRYGVPRHHVTQIYERSTVINNIIIGDNNTIINQGIPRERVETATGSEIRRVAVRDWSHRERPHVRPERLEREGDSLVVYRPAPEPVAAPATGSGEPRSAARPERPGRVEGNVAAGDSLRAPLRTAPGRTGLAYEPAGTGPSPGTPPAETRRAPRPERPAREANEIGASDTARNPVRPTPERSAVTPAPVPSPSAGAPAARIRPSPEIGPRPETRPEPLPSRAPERAGMRPAEPTPSVPPAAAAPPRPEPPAAESPARGPVRVHTIPARPQEARPESPGNVTVIGRPERPARPAPVMGARPSAPEPTVAPPLAPAPVPPQVATPPRMGGPTPSAAPTAHWQPNRPAPPAASAPTPAAPAPLRMNPPAVARPERTPRADSPVVIHRPEAPRITPPSPAVSPQPFAPPARVAPPSPPPTAPQPSRSAPVMIPAPSRPAFSPPAAPAPAVVPSRPAAPPSAPAPVFSAPPAAERPSAPAPRSRGRAHED